MAGGRKKKITLSAELLATATPREMAAAYCSIIDERDLTAEEKEALNEKFKDMKPSKVKEFQKYRNFNRALMFAYYPILKLAQGMFEREAHAVLSRLLCLKADICGASTFTNTYRLYKQTIIKRKEDEEELKKDLLRFFNPASTFAADKIHLTFDDNDRAVINETEVVEDIRKEIWEKGVILESLEYFKAGVEAVNDWAERNDLRAFIPKWVRVVMEEARVDYSEELGLQRYSRAHLREREERGDNNITDLDRQIAILPCYDEVIVSTDVWSSWAKKLEETLYERK